MEPEHTIEEMVEATRELVKSARSAATEARDAALARAAGDR